ncbi:MAG: hypothetical protein ACE5KH_03065 [Candidatus Geothermarchaeales archaeon]
MKQTENPQSSVALMYWSAARRRDLKIGLLLIFVSIALVVGLYVSRELETFRRMIVGVIPLVTDLDFAVVSVSLVTGAIGAYYVGKRFVNGRETRGYATVLMGAVLFLLSVNVLGFSESTKGREAIQAYAGVADIYQLARYAGMGSAVLIAIGVLLFLLYRKGLSLRTRYTP